MENNFNNRDFEQFVKQNADQYRMFPSEKVWDGIHASLHTRSRWYGIGLALLLLTAVAVTWVMLIPSNKNQQLADKLPVTTITINQAIAAHQQSAPIIVTPAKPASQGQGSMLHPENQEKNLFIADVVPVTTDEPGTAIVENITTPSITIPEPAYAVNNTGAIVENIVRHSPVLTAQAEVKTDKPAETIVASIPTDNEPPVKSNEVRDEPVTASQPAAKEYPLTIESIVNSYVHLSKKSRFSMRAFFTPTISYRRLSENNTFLSAANAAPGTMMTLASEDVNNVVTHKPDLGLQLGVNIGYELRRDLTFIAGLQFNVNKYDIRAYDYPSETATIALTSGSNRSTQTTYRNYSGSKTENWLHNLYFSASLPIGLEVRVSDRNKREIGIAGTIQPTYMLGNRTYLLSTDYKNYAEVPSLVRKWNLNGGFEVFATYSTGKVDWRVGPQVRYQLFSSFSETYPVKEHLFDFGLKIGITLDK